MYQDKDGLLKVLLSIQTPHVETKEGHRRVLKADNSTNQLERKRTNECIQGEVEK